MCFYQNIAVSYTFPCSNVWNMYDIFWRSHEVTWLARTNDQSESQIWVSVWSTIVPRKAYGEKYSKKNKITVKYLKRYKVYPHKNSKTKYINKEKKNIQKKNFRIFSIWFYKTTPPEKRKMPFPFILTAFCSAIIFCITPAYPNPKHLTWPFCFSVD